MHTNLMEASIALMFPLVCLNIVYNKPVLVAIVEILMLKNRDRVLTVLVLNASVCASNQSFLFCCCSIYVSKIQILSYAYHC